ncbi:MAG: hypothetical protein FGF50_10785 [Candidatus Brockarchaeota archaeon]|nr:hypothetical protein [Candidatus Brockarchaeota archaeon]
MVSAKKLIEVLNGDVKLNLEIELETNSLIELAYKNKVLLYLLRALNIQGSLRETQEKTMRNIIEVVKNLSKALKGYDHALFKLLKPVSYVPADVDVLVDADKVKRAAKEVMGLGYEPIVKDPYCITLTRGNSIVDLYTQPSIGGVVFINGQGLLNHTRIVEFNEAEVRTLERYAEALATASHAIYKECIYTLNDYFTIRKWTTGKSFKLAEELSCRPALELSIKLNRLIEEATLETPYRLPHPIWLTIMMRKLREDQLTKATLANILKTMRDPRIGRLVMSRLTDILTAPTSTLHHVRTTSYRWKSVPQP